MKAFHNDEKIKSKYVNRVRQHIKLDHLIRGQGWTGTKGCAVGCTLEKYEHRAYEEELGIPEWLARVEDTLFEGMTVEKSKTWPLEFLKAIKPGVDLEKIKGPFLIFVLQSVLETFDHAKFPEVKQSIDSVIDLWEIGGTEQDFRDAAAYAAAYAARAAYAAAYAARAAYAVAYAAYAARSAAYAARSTAAAYAAYAAADAATYDKFGDKLLKLLRGCK